MRPKTELSRLPKVAFFIAPFLIVPLFLSFTALASDSNGIHAKSTKSAVSENIGAIARLDDQYKAVIAFDKEHAFKQARKIDQMSAESRAQMAIPAITILLKDNIESKEYATTAGSLALLNNHTQRDADLVANLRKEGAIILGKTNLSEWANFRSEHSISGWSAIGGQTKNAADATRSPCGSSSGSAVAVALGYSDAAIGTETDGSIVCPAAVNGVVGIKPTHGLISGKGIVPLATTQDTAGPIAKNVQDAALVLSAMIGPGDQQSHKELKKLLSQTITASDLKGKKLGVLAHTTGYDSRRDQLLDNAVANIKLLGGSIIPGLSFSPYEGFWDDSYDVLLYEFKRDLNRYLASLPNELSSLTLSRLIQFNNQHAEKELQYFDQSIFIKSEQLELTEKAYQEKLSRIKKAAREEGIDKLMKEHNLDALIGITIGPAWKIDKVNGDAFFGPSLSSYPAIAGNPHITVPMGEIGGLPVGLSFIGKRYEDAALTRIAHSFELSHQH